MANHGQQWSNVPSQQIFSQYESQQWLSMVNVVYFWVHNIYLAVKKTWVYNINLLYLVLFPLLFSISLLCLLLNSVYNINPLCLLIQRVHIPMVYNINARVQHKSLGFIMLVNPWIYKSLELIMMGEILISCVY